MVNMGGLLLKHQPTKLLTIVALALMISTPIFLTNQAAAQTNGYYHKSFAWDYDGNHWTWNLSIPVDLYDAYKSVPISTRTRDGPAGYGFCTTTEDAYLQTLAKELNDTATRLKYDSFDQVSFVLSFVQSLPYTSDSVTTGRDEYPRFPIETLVDDGGDCEDTSILFATLTLILGYDTLYLNPPNHYAVGILGNDLRGTFWTYPEGSNKTYYYCETTGDNFKIGQLPEAFQGQSAYIYTIDERKQFVPQVVALPTSEPTGAPVTTSSTPTLQPNPTGSTSPTITEPSIQPVLPLSFNLIADNPLFFILIAFAIIISISLAVWSTRKTKRQPAEAPAAPVPIIQQAEIANSEGSKFCIFCGSSNKAFAVYCVNCGKQIG